MDLSDIFIRQVTYKDTPSGEKYADRDGLYPKEVMTGHGFRAMARTVLDEVLGERVDLIEHQLAHSVIAPNGRAYNRTAHLPARRAMMQRWADYLDKLRMDGDCLTLTSNG